MATDDRQKLAVLADLVNQAQRDVDSSKRQLQENEERLSSASSLLDYEQRRVDSLPKAKAVNGRFAGKGLRDAALEVLRESEGKTIRAEALIQILSEAGFEIRSEHPGRALHAALLVDEVERPGKGLYRWVVPNGASPALPGGG